MIGVLKERRLARRGDVPIRLVVRPRVETLKEVESDVLCMGPAAHTPLLFTDQWRVGVRAFA